MNARLRDAVDAADWPRCKRLLLEEARQSRAAIGLGEETDLTALQLAALHDEEVANTMLARGVECDLHSAAALGRVGEIAASATPRRLAALAEHLPPLGFALVRAQLGSVRALLAAGDDPSRSLPRIGFFVWELEALAAGFGAWSPLQAASTHGYAADAAAIVRTLLDAGAVRDAVSPLGARPIHLASIYGWLPVLGALLDAGADVDSRSELVADAVWRLSAPSHAQNVGGQTPLMVAVTEGRTEAARWLIARGADVHARDDSGGSALHAAARPWWGEEPTLAKLLREAGADPAARDAAGRTPREIALGAGFEATAAVLASPRSARL